MWTSNETSNETKCREIRLNPRQDLDLLPDGKKRKTLKKQQKREEKKKYHWKDVCQYYQDKNFNKLERARQHRKSQAAPRGSKSWKVFTQEEGGLYPTNLNSWHDDLLVTEERVDQMIDYFKSLLQKK